jgi:RecA-family ATPase
MSKDTDCALKLPNAEENKINIKIDAIDAEVDNFSTSDSDEEITGEQLLLMKVEEIPCLVYPLLQQIGLACVGGSSDIGKSTLLRQLAMAIVLGKTDFLGFKINAKWKSVIYVATEDLQRETAYLLSKQSNGCKPDQLRGLRFVFETDDLYNKLDRRLTNNPADAVIIDCFADSYGGDLKDTQKIRTFLHPYQELAQKHQCLMLLLHHVAKRTEYLEPSKNNLLAGQGFESKMRLVIELRADLMNPSLRHLCVVKGNYVPLSCKKESYVLNFDEQNFLFTNTGDRMPFELLSKQQDADNSRAKYEQAKELKEQGYSYELIAQTIGYGSKGSVSKLFDKAKTRGWDNSVSNGNGGNE